MSTPSSTLLALQVLENDPELLWSVFQKFDVDGTGYIEVEEIQEVQWETSPLRTLASPSWAWHCGKLQSRNFCSHAKLASPAAAGAL